MGGTTVEMKLDEIIALAAGSQDPIGGSTHVNNAADAAKGSPANWVQCKAELEQVN